MLHETFHFLMDAMIFKLVEVQAVFIWKYKCLRI